MSFTIDLRLAGAILGALPGALWLAHATRRPLSDPTDSPDTAPASPTAPAGPSRPLHRVSRALRGITIFLAGFWSLTWLLLAAQRLPYPFELEWIGGAMRDHCARIVDGKPLYVAPGPDFFPYEYPPLYFWASAAAVSLTGCSIYIGMRTVSILSTLGCVALIFLWTRRLIQNGEKDNPKSKIQNPKSPPSFVWPALAAGLLLASYRLTGAWYDVERLDMLFLFLSLLGIYWLDCGGRWAAPAACAFALAFLTKQQAVLFILGGVAALAWRREWLPLAIFGSVALVACAVPCLLLNRQTAGWFGYYCFHVPLANGIQWHLAWHYLLADLPLYLPMILLAGILWCRLYPTRGEALAQVGRDAMLIAMTLMALLGSLLSRAHWGGDQNVLIPGFLFLGLVACVLAGRYERTGASGVTPLYALVLVQLLVCTYRPGAQLPTAANLAVGRRHLQAIRGLEREGEVLCLDHGGQTSPAHFQTMALLDVMNADKRMPSTLTAALQAHRYVAIVTDVVPSPDSLLGRALADTYAPAGCLHLDATWTVTGYPTPGPGRPVWVLRPIHHEGRAGVY